MYGDDGGLVVRRPNGLGAYVLYDIHVPACTSRFVFRSMCYVNQVCCCGELWMNRVCPGTYWDIAKAMFVDFVWN